MTLITTVLHSASPTATATYSLLLPLVYACFTAIDVSLLLNPSSYRHRITRRRAAYARLYGGMGHIGVRPSIPIPVSRPFLLQLPSMLRARLSLPVYTIRASLYVRVEEPLCHGKTVPFGVEGRLYGQSKMGNILASNYWAKTHSDVLVSCAVHPGTIKSELLREQSGWIKTLTNLGLHPTPMGVLAQLWAGTVATPAEITGQYVVPWGKVAKTEKRTKSAKLEADVIAFLKEQVQGF
ncbi:hypothetical protein FB45DRAFT_1041349 [Roridomyces roridus]|uniref:Uncharacterized protein n=1 Tax=Roridomyces roridus TaxID=1738132 RepID=A0AAD7B0C1_9AGAR|nr:hypothetical protein FB45DRAFT_1041349 [Roridomyces roridus]